MATLPAPAARGKAKRPARAARPRRLFHATLVRNLPSIQRAGLLCSKSQGRLPVVWLCAPSASTWAVLHTVRRHGGTVEGVVLIEVDVPRSWLRRSPRRNLWYCPRDIRPGRLGPIHGFAQLAGARAEG